LPDRCNRAAIAVQGIGGHDLALQRDQAQHFECRLQFAARIGCHRGQCQAQTRGESLDHHPGPRTLARTLALVARAPQRLAVEGDHITIAEQQRDLRQNPTEGRIQRPRVDHPEHGGEGIMRGDGMLELQEAPENMLFCPTEVCHLGTAGCPAENRDEANDQQLAKVVARIVGTRIGDVIEGGKEDVVHSEQSCHAAFAIR
jgi:hypothetical protein